MMSIYKKMLLLVFFFLSFLIVQPCFSEKEPYNVGAIFSLTGGLSPLGTAEKGAADIVVERINRSGGINGHILNMIVYDDGSEPTKGVMAVRRLIASDKVVAIIGPSSSSTTQSVIPIIEKAEIPLLYVAGSNAFVHPVKKWVFKVPGGHDLGVIRLFESYCKPKSIKKIAVIYNSDAYGRDGRNEVIRLAPKFGITVVMEEKFDPKDTDMTVQLTKVKRSDAQAFVCWATNPEPAIVARNRVQIGLEIPMLQAAGALNDKFLELAGKFAEGVILPAHKLAVAEQILATDPDKEMMVSFKKEYLNKFKTEANIFSGYGYDAITMVSMALRAVGPDSAKIRDYIENLKGYRGLTGVYNLTPQDHIGLSAEYSSPYIVEVRDGKFKIIGGVGM
jgi:branched-chain amino acid transport system substrate-binding protein